MRINLFLSELSIENSQHTGDTVIDPKLQSCEVCNCHFYITKFQQLRMLLFGDIRVRCPRCQSRMRFRLVYHSVKVSNERNERVFDVWRKG